MRKKKVSAAVLSITEKVIRREVGSTQKFGPPYCSGIFHQPKRPKATKQNNQ